MAISQILVGVDGSPNGLAAVGWAAQLAQKIGAAVIAVHAVGLLEHVGPAGEAVPAEPHRAEVQQAFEEEWCAPFHAAGVTATRLLRYGTPVTALLAVADEHDADLIVVGSRGQGGFPQLLLGSTSTQVAQHSKCPVTIVPANWSA